MILPVQILTTLLPLFTGGSTHNGPSQQPPPPGMVTITGGNTEIGNDRKVIQDLVSSGGNAERFVQALDSETPGHKIDVKSFFLMITEVTNEQYLEYVRATGIRPPQHWGKAAVDKARMEFLSDRANKGTAWDPERWWDKNWEGVEYTVAPDDLLRPVMFVNHADAKGYCEWLGMRLPTEEELQRAVRGSGKDFYPWGSEWPEGNYANTSEFRQDNAVLPVGIFPEGVSKEGVYDLVGNAWEWTNSPYLPYPGFKPGKYKGTTRKKLEPKPQWNGDDRVAFGGSYQNPAIAARCTTRRNTARFQRTTGLGFRAVGTMKPGFDLAERVYRLQIRSSPARSEGARTDSNLATVLENWNSKLTAYDKAAATKDTRQDHYKNYVVPDAYRVITDYQHIAFVPVERIDEANAGTWKKSTIQQGPAMLGFLSTTEEWINPALPPGTYIVSYRAKGDPEKPRSAEDDGEEELFEEDDTLDENGIPKWMAQIDPKQHNLLFFEAKTGELTSHMEIRTEPKQGKPQGSNWSITQVKVEYKDEKGKRAFRNEDRLMLTAEIPHRLRGKVVTLEMVAKVNPSTLRQSWRGMK
ncbi:MAG: hypothetical protein CMJ86_01525 [Planctomycetes bacterium]|nr:hypothetical protein [Planctomycetota bacterium]